ncbi:hypothetical protein V8G54_026915 [Vigna mungo]|uniref:Uncharacterized protein n=1 Tax=Vigna mungo TaxID=3915 RepID=A0AAQ3N1X2_VIGMU
MESLILPLSAFPAKPSPHVLSSVSAELTHVSTLLMCQAKSCPFALQSFSSFSDRERRSTLSLISSAQSLRAAYSRGLRPLNLLHLATKVLVDSVRLRARERAVWTSWCGSCWMAAAYTESDSTQRAGYWVALQEDFMKLVGLEAAKQLWRVQRTTRRRISKLAIFGLIVESKGKVGSEYIEKRRRE